MRQLDKYDSHTFAYGADGIRYKKDNTTYTLSGTKILKETNGSRTLTYYYGNGGVVGFQYNGFDYFFLKNLQGDVISIYDECGSIVAGYHYDAWGKVLDVWNFTDDDLGDINPFRYRSYYYDTETGLYYLNSRYYDPETGRFINADSTKYLGINGMLVGYNLYAYCNNNPVYFVDRRGTNTEALQWWLGGMGWLPASDTALFIGDIIYVAGVFIIGAIVLTSSDQESHTEILEDLVMAEYGSPSPNNDDDDDDDDDYYNDESNFGGRKRMGKSKGKAPRNNQKQNEQFRAATRKLSQDKQRALHNKITGQGLGFEELVEAAKDFMLLLIALFALED